MTKEVVELGDRALLCCSNFSHDLLNGNVHWLTHWMQHVQVTSTHCREQSGALHKFISGHGIDAALGCATDMVIGSTNALQEGRNGPWGTELTDEVNWTNINSKFKRSSGDKGL